MDAFFVLFNESESDGEQEGPHLKRRKKGGK